MARNLVPGHTPDDDAGGGRDDTPRPDHGDGAAVADDAPTPPLPGELATGFGAFDLDPPARLLRRSKREDGT